MNILRIDQANGPDLFYGMCIGATVADPVGGSSGFLTAVGLVPPTRLLRLSTAGLFLLSQGLNSIERRRNK